ncbi:radical SAM protein [Gemmatimonadota bacterium]
MKSQVDSAASPDAGIRAQFELYTPQTGHPDWEAVHADALELAEVIRPRLTPPPSRWRDMRRQMRSYATLVHNHLANMLLARKGRHDLWPLYFLWTTHRNCNFRCTYCDDHRENRYPDLADEGALTTDEACRLLRILRTRIPSALFSGGEPTLRDDLPQITRRARELDYFPIIIDTNGSLVHRLLREPAWSTWLADLDHLVVSLDSLDCAVLTQMWDYPRSEEIVRNILLLRELSREHRFQLMISTVVQPGFIQDAREVLDFSNDLGLCFCPMPSNIGSSIDRRLLEDPGYLHLVDMIIERKRAGFPVAGSERLNRRMMTAVPLQCRNTIKPHIDHKGYLWWPCNACTGIEPVKVRVLDHRRVEELYAQAVGLIDPTGFQDVCGGHCNWSQHYTTDAYVDGLNHPRRLISEITRFIRNT